MRFQCRKSPWSNKSLRYSSPASRLSSRLCTGRKAPGYNPVISADVSSPQFVPPGANRPLGFFRVFYAREHNTPDFVKCQLLSCCVLQERGTFSVCTFVKYKYFIPLADVIRSSQEQPHPLVLFRPCGFRAEDPNGLNP